MAHMQLMIEKRSKKKSSLAQVVSLSPFPPHTTSHRHARIVQVGIPELGDEEILKLSRDALRRMNYAQLQVIANDLHTQIESRSRECACTLYC